MWLHWRSRCGFNYGGAGFGGFTAFSLACFGGGASRNQCTSSRGMTNYASIWRLKSDFGAEIKYHRGPARRFGWQSGDLWTLPGSGHQCGYTKPLLTWYVMVVVKKSKRLCNLSWGYGSRLNVKDSCRSWKRGQQITAVRRSWWTLWWLLCRCQPGRAILRDGSTIYYKLNLSKQLEIRSMCQLFTGRSWRNPNDLRRGSVVVPYQCIREMSSPQLALNDKPFRKLCGNRRSLKKKGSLMGQRCLGWLQVSFDSNPEPPN